jgi:hypothetical protein
MPHTINECPNRITDPLDHIGRAYLSQMFGGGAQDSEYAPRPFVCVGDQWEIQVYADTGNPDRWVIEGVLWRLPEALTEERREEAMHTLREDGRMAAAMLRCNIDASTPCTCSLEDDKSERE